MTLAHPFNVLLGLLGRGAEEEIPICSQEPGGTGLMVDWCRVDEASALVDRLVGRNVWFGVQPTARPDKGRGTSKSVTGLVALYVDIDFADGKTLGMGVDRADAMDVVGRLTEAIGAGPCAIVSTGHGLQPYWAIERCDRVDGALLLVRWKQVVKRVCDDMGIKLDMGVYDLPRILRVPGTVNVKGEPVDTGLTVKSQAGPLLLEVVHSNINVWFMASERESPSNPGFNRESMRALMDNPGVRQDASGLDRVFTDEQAADFLEEHAWRPARETPWGGGQDYWKVIWQCAMVASHFTDMYDEQDLRERLRAEVLEGHGQETNAADDYQIELGFIKGGDWLARRPTEVDLLNPFSNARDEQRIVENQGGIRAYAPGGPGADQAVESTTEWVQVDQNGVIVASSSDTIVDASTAPGTSQNGDVFNPFAKHPGPAPAFSDSPDGADMAGLTKGPWGTPIGPGGRRLVVTSAADIDAKVSRWLWEWKNDRGVWEHWLPLGGLVLLGGREGVGKSTWTARLAAQITRGDMAGEYLGQPRGVVLCASEDSWEHTIIPRLLAAGADLKMVWRVDAQVDERACGLTLPTDVPALKALIAEKNVALVVLDPLLGTIGGRLDTHKDSDVRIALEPITRLANDTGATIIGLIHQNKNASGDLATRMMGSRAFVAVARAALVCMAHKDDDDSDEMPSSNPDAPRAPRRFLFGQIKNNLAAKIETSALYELEGVEVAREKGTDRPIWSSKVKLVSYTHDEHVDDADTRQERAANKKTDGRKKPEGAKATCADWVRRQLMHGPNTKKNLIELAENDGYEFSVATMARALTEVAEKAGGSYHDPLWKIRGQA